MMSTIMNTISTKGERETTEFNPQASFFGNEFKLKLLMYADDISLLFSNTVNQVLMKPLKLVNIIYK